MARVTFAGTNTMKISSGHQMMVISKKELLAVRDEINLMVEHYTTAFTEPNLSNEDISWLDNDSWIEP